MTIDVPAAGGSYTRDPVTGALAPATVSTPEAEAPMPATMPADPAGEKTANEPKASKKEK